MKVMVSSKTAEAIVVGAYVALCTAGIVAFGTISYAAHKSRKNEESIREFAARMQGWAEGVQDGMNIAKRDAEKKPAEDDTDEEAVEE